MKVEKLRNKNHKKLKTFSDLIDLDVFSRGIIVFVTNDMIKVSDKFEIFNRVPNNDFEGRTAPFEGGQALCFLKPHVDVETISHEANHLFNFLCEDVGYKPKRKNDEMQSYHVGWIAKQLENAVKKYNKLY